MCGIAGWLHPTHISPASGELERMTEAIAHRGPDGSGHVFFETGDGHTIALGHRRLSIIDLEGGSQPMQDESGEVTIIFNGEIYNHLELRLELEALGHSFSTGSDTEAIIGGWKEWGRDVIPRLRGQFAFALWDAEEGCLLLARDAYGMKPLYVRHDDDGFYFASEIKALLSIQGAESEFDSDAIWTYMRFRYTPWPSTMFKGITKMPPGSAMLWKAGSLQSWRWYVNPDSQRRNSNNSEEAPISAFLARFEESVRIRMMSDVPFGAFLSGGIDSAAVVSMMSRHSNEPIKTFSVGFEESEYSELDHAAATAKTFGCDHTSLIIRPEDLMEHLPELIRLRDAPVAEPSDIPIHLLALKASDSVKMVLTGEGSDEFLAGYEKHGLEGPAAIYRRLTPRFLHRMILEPVIRALPFSMHRWKTAMASVGLSRDPERMARWFGAMSERERARLCTDVGASDVGSNLPFTTSRGNSRLRRILHFDQLSWLPDNLLERGDRMTMGASIEARMPFMDTELAAWISSLPDRMRRRRGSSKRILRLAMAEVLPTDILNRPKVGFRVPVSDWFRDEMHEWLRDLLMGESSLTKNLYLEREVERILDDHRRSRQNHEKLLWTMATLELFHREYSEPVTITTS